ncbi:MAG: HAD family hydrolase [Anaerovoracaceae bacterium]
MIKAILFDADGTLMDSIASWRKALRTVLERRGFPYSEEDFQVLIPLTTKEGGAYLKEKYGFAETGDEIAAEYLGLVEGFYATEVELKKGVREALEYYAGKGIPMAIVTSSERILIEAACKCHGISQYFQGLYICSELGTSKRNPDIFVNTAKILGAQPAEALVYEDSDYAIETAVKAGFKVIKVIDELNIVEVETEI